MSSKATPSRRVGTLSVISLAAALLVVLATCLPVAASSAYTSGTTGYDISYNFCNKTFPPNTGNRFAILGVTGGRAFTQNSCLSGEYRWAVGGGLTPSLYMNLNYAIGSTGSEGSTGPMGTCRKNDKACIAYNYGYNAASNAWSYAVLQSASASVWWLDIETANSWSPKTSLNAEVIKGAIAFLQAQGVTVGIYSTPAIWQTIAGSYSPGLPNWVAGTPSLSALPSYCAPSYAFGGGTVWLTQYGGGSYDVDYAC